MCAVVPCACLNIAWSWPQTGRVISDPVEKPNKKPIGLRPKDTHPTTDPAHDFGDTLEYEITVPVTLIVTVELKTSTYEGRCMNYPVGGPAGEDTISDLIPDTAGWDLHTHEFVDSLSVFTLTDTLAPGIRTVKIRVMDYAAEGDLKVWETADTTNIAQFSQKIPPNYEQWKSVSDADSDGFTAWEEHRGFLGVGVQAHTRLDTAQAEMLFWDFHQYLVGDTLLALQSACSCLPLNCTSMQQGQFRLEVDNRRFVDFESRFYNGTSHAWIANPLCDPLFDPPNCPDPPYAGIADADQAIVQIVPLGKHPGDTLGTYVCGNTDQLPRDSTPPLDTLFLPGGDACNGIVIYQISLDSLVRWLVQNNGLPASDTLAVKSLFCLRSILHEFGHAQGITHHTPCPPCTTGVWQCVMKYASNSDWIEWPAFIARGPGTEYSDDQWQCLRQRHLRPH